MRRPSNSALKVPPTPLNGNAVAAVDEEADAVVEVEAEEVISPVGDRMFREVKALLVARWVFGLRCSRMVKFDGLVIILFACLDRFATGLHFQFLLSGSAWHDINAKTSRNVMVSTFFLSPGKETCVRCL
jgi:hypothetical protein